MYASSSVNKIFLFGGAAEIMSFLLAFVASLQLGLATTTGRLLRSAICLPHKDVSTKDTTSEFAGVFSKISLLC